jgi:hypothetical protein
MIRKAAEDFYVPLIPDRFKLEEWRASPAALDHTIPSSNWCAMTLVRMTFLAYDLKAPTLEELWEGACAAGVYVPKRVGEGWSGAHHEPLATFIERLGFSVIREEATTLNLVKSIVTESLPWVAFLSVSPEIRFHRDTEPTKRNGHMVLAYDCERLVDGSRVFLIQNPAGFASLNSQIGVRISETRLQQVFSGNAIFVSRKYFRP